MTAYVLAGVAGSSRLAPTEINFSWPADAKGGHACKLHSHFARPLMKLASAFSPAGLHGAMHSNNNFPGALIPAGLTSENPHILRPNFIPGGILGAPRLMAPFGVVVNGWEENKRCWGLRRWPALICLTLPERSKFKLTWAERTLALIIITRDVPS